MNREAKPISYTLYYFREDKKERIFLLIYWIFPLNIMKNFLNYVYRKWKFCELLIQDDSEEREKKKRLFSEQKETFLNTGKYISNEKQFLTP